MAQPIKLPVDILIKEDSSKTYLTNREFTLGFFMIQGWVIESDTNSQKIVITEDNQPIKIDDISAISFDENRSNGFVYCQNRQVYKNDASALHPQESSKYFEYLKKSFGEKIRVVEQFVDFYPVKLEN